MFFLPNSIIPCSFKNDVWIFSAYLLSLAISFVIPFFIFCFEITFCAWLHWIGVLLNEFNTGFAISLNNINNYRCDIPQSLLEINCIVWVKLRDFHNWLCHIDIGLVICECEFLQSRLNVWLPSREK